MDLVRLTAYFVLLQCVAAGAAFAVPAAVPEPASMTLMAVGVGAITIARKWRKRR